MSVASRRLLRLAPLAGRTAFPAHASASSESLPTIPHLLTTLKTRPSVTLPRFARHTRQFRTTTANMSFSNTDTGDKHADPYKQKNLEDPSVDEKVKDLLAFVKRCKFCMMTTRIESTGLLASRCMALAGEENGVDLVFHANTESGKTDDLASDPDINLGFLNNSGEWASISGKATVETDRSLVHKHYSPALKAWLGDLGDGKHDGGPNDPRICIIKVNAKTAQYAVSRDTAIGGFIKFAEGVVTGEAPSVNKLRYLEESELDQYRKTAGQSA